MNLTQERINEIALDLAADWIDESTPDDVIVHFANLFLSRIREEQEPFCWAVVSTGRFTRDKKIGVGLKSPVVLFAIPPAAPECNCKELVEALESCNAVLRTSICFTIPDDEINALIAENNETLDKHKASMGEKE